MKKKIFTLLTLLATVCSGAWAAVTTVNTWDFAAYQQTVANKTGVSYLSSTVSINGVGCNLGSGEADGLAFQGANKWFYYTSGGLYNGNGGGRTVGILNLKAGDVITISANATFEATANATSTADNVFSVTADGNVGLSLARYNTIFSITVTREVSDDTCEDPTSKISGVDGTARKFTLACLTPNSTIYYSETEKAVGDAGWTEYAGEVTTSAETIWAYAKTASANSSVISFATGAGEAITLNTPVITNNAYTAGNYTLSISSDQSALSVVPASVSYKYTIDGGAAQDYTAPVAVAEGSTLKAYAVSDGYTNSEEATLVTVARPALTSVWSIDFTNGADDKGGVTVGEEAFTADEVSFGNITADNLTSNDNFGVKVGSSWLLRNASRGLYSFNGSGTPVGVANVTAGQYIKMVVSDMTSCSASGAATLQEGMSTATELYMLASEDGNVNINLNRYVFIKSIEVLNVAPASESITVTDAGFATYVSAYDLDFSATTSIKAYSVKVTEKGVATMTQVDNVPAGTPVLLYAEGGATESIPTMAGAAAVANNDLVAGKGAAVATEDGENTNMILNVGSNGAGFYYANDQFVGTNRAYLHFATTLSPAAGARMILSFGETTGIESVKSADNKVQSGVYNIAGQRVAQPTKGLYIVNGKKVIVK